MIGFFEQTQSVSGSRRTELRRVNTTLVIERMSGLVFALVVTVLGLGIAAYLGLHDMCTMQIDAQDILGRKVDLVTHNAVHPSSYCMSDQLFEQEAPGQGQATDG